jgi:hypothetical protein
MEDPPGALLRPEAFDEVPPAPGRAYVCAEPDDHLKLQSRGDTR